MAAAVAEAQSDEESLARLKCKPTDGSAAPPKPFDFVGIGGKVGNTSGMPMLFGPDGKLTASARKATPGHSDFVQTVTISVEGEVSLDAFNNWVAKFLNENGERVYRFKGLIAAKVPQRPNAPQNIVAKSLTDRPTNQPRCRTSPTDWSSKPYIWSSLASEARPGVRMRSECALWS